MSVAVTKYTTVRQIVEFVKHIKEGEGIILMFHSVISKDDPGYGRDNWYFDAEKFDRICNIFNKNANVSVCTTKDLISKL